MNSEQLTWVKEHFDEISYGIPIDEIKRLRLRPFVRRIQRRVDGKQISLYCLTNNYIEEIKTTLAKDRNEEIEAIVPLPKIDEPESLTNDYLACLPSTDFLNITESPLSSSSIIDSSSENSTKSRLAINVQESIVHGECDLNNLTDRVLLIRKYFKRLCDGGLTLDEITKYDLYGMLNKYLKPTKDKKFELSPESSLHINYFISRYYKGKTHECLAFAKRIYEKYGLYRLSSTSKMENRSYYNALNKLMDNVVSYAQKVDEFINNNSLDKETHEKIEELIDAFESETKYKPLKIKCFSQYVAHSREEVQQTLKSIQKFISSSQEVSNNSFPSLDVNELWNKHLSEVEKDNIIELIKNSYVYVEKYGQEIGHPFNFHIFIITAIYSIITKFMKNNTSRYPTDKEVYEMSIEINNNEVAECVSAYLDKDVCGKP